MITHGYRLKMLNPFGGVKKIDKLLETDQLNQEFARLVEQITRRLLQAGLQGEEQFYEEVVKVTDEVLPCETTAIFILQNGEFQRMKVTTNLEAELPPEIYQPGEGLTGQALKRSSTGELSGQIFLYNTVSRKLHKNRVVEGNKTFLEIYQKQLPSGQVRHLLALPIYGPDYDKVVGILQVMNKLKHPSSTALSQVGFINRDVALLTIIATLVGNTLHNQHHLNRLKKLASISVGMESLTTPKKLYRYVAQEAAKVIGAEDCSIFRVDAAGEYLELVESLTTPPTDFGEHWRLRISQTPGCGLTAYVAASKKPEFFKGKEYKSHPACRDYHEHYRYLPSRDCHSLLIIPLLDFKGECLGVMRLTNKTQPDRINSFDQEDYEIAKTLGSQLANALRRETHFQHKNQQLKDFLKAQVKLLQLGQYGLEHLGDPALA
ncbi:MAG: GAF domain-containing protein, partial [Chloroflexota bacterium]